MNQLAVLVCSVLGAAAAQFVPPDAVLQAGYPAGFRAYIPDFPGCEAFAFHGKVNSPFSEEEDGSLFQEILRPQGGFWVFQDLSVILSPGDIIYYWTLIVKDKVGYPKRNMTWKVPDPDESVDLLSPITFKPPKTTPEKLSSTETTTQLDDITTPLTEMNTKSSEETVSPSTTEPSETSTSTPSPSPTTQLTTAAPKPSTTTKPKNTQSKKDTSSNPLKEQEVEELTTPATPFDKPSTSEFPDELPSLFPFPSIFPRPLKPMMPPSGPGFEICSNPWNFEEQVGETKTQRLERQVAKLQCELAFFQRGYTQFGNRVENELNDLKKLIYGMVGRMARLESVIRAAAFG